MFDILKQSKVENIYSNADMPLTNRFQFETVQGFPIRLAEKKKMNFSSKSKGLCDKEIQSSEGQGSMPVEVDF